MTMIRNKKMKESGASTQRPPQPISFKLVSDPTMISGLDR
jgi:hypothetical protein